MTQMPPPDFGTFTIPMEKALLFSDKKVVRTIQKEGVFLEMLIAHGIFKRRIQEIEGIGIERDLAGLPVLYGPEGVDLWDKIYQKMRI